MVDRKRLALRLEMREGAQRNGRRQGRAGVAAPPPPPRAACSSTPGVKSRSTRCSRWKRCARRCWCSTARCARAGGRRRRKRRGRADARAPRSVLLLAADVSAEVDEAGERDAGAAGRRQQRIAGRSALRRLRLPTTSPPYSRHGARTSCWSSETECRYRVSFRGSIWNCGSVSRMT